MPDRAAPPSPRKARLRITEIFYSLQGESRPVGFPTVFIRLTGCPLRCRYCDTEYAFSGGEQMSIDAVIEAVADYNTRYVCVTGGEPLAQPGCAVLLTGLCDGGYEVLLETSGALDISGVDRRVTVVMDIKTPASGEADRMLWSNLEHLKPTDQIKLVLSDRSDYEWARQLIETRGLAGRCSVLLSPAWGQLAERDLADWILADRLAVQFQIQLHKHLWGDVPGH